MSLAKAKAIGLKRCRLGRLWPMPVRETDLGHIYADLTVKPLVDSAKSWTGKALVDTGATDTFLLASVLHKLGIKPAGKRSYELADGSVQDLPIGFGVVEVEGLPAGCTLVFAGEKEEPFLGVTVLESTGLWLDPQRERLIRRKPKRKGGNKKKKK
jgi:clan AA aspartic protease